MAQILVVDDDPLIISLVERKLREAGYTVHTAENGQKALQLLPTSRVDLIITDVMMPVMDGWEFVRELRIRPECAFLPVIFLTALNSANDRVKGFRLGADDYLAKPFKAEELLSRVERTLRNGESIHRLAQSSMEQAEGFEGGLDQIGFSSLLVLLEMERKTGELVVSRGNEKGILQLRDGRILNARLEGATVPEDAKFGSECIYYLVRWGDGQFLFTPTPISTEDVIRSSTTALLKVGSHRISEPARS